MDIILDFLNVVLFINIFTGLFSRYPAEMNVTWKSGVKNYSTNKYTLGPLTSRELLLRLQKNQTIKVFDRLYPGLKRKKLAKMDALSLKMDLLNEYTHPAPFPTDMFRRLPNGSTSQAYIMLGQIGTGKATHTFLL